jgi:hypothetical protein
MFCFHGTHHFLWMLQTTSEITEKKDDKLFNYVNLVIYIKFYSNTRLGQIYTWPASHRSDGDVPSNALLASPATYGARCLRCRRFDPAALTTAQHDRAAFPAVLGEVNIDLRLGAPCCRQSLQPPTSG